MDNTIYFILGLTCIYTGLLTFQFITCAKAIDRVKKHYQYRLGTKTDETIKYLTKAPSRYKRDMFKVKYNYFGVWYVVSCDKKINGFNLRFRKAPVA